MSKTTGLFFDAKLLLFSLLGFEALNSLCNYFGRRELSRGASLVLLRVRFTLFERLSKLSLPYLDREPLGRIVTRMAHDVEGLEELFSGGLARVVICVVSVLVTIVSLIILDGRIGGLAVLAMLPTMGVLLWGRALPRIRNRSVLARQSAINAKLAEFIRGVFVIRLFGLEEWSENVIKKITATQLGEQNSLNSFFSIQRPIQGFTALFPFLTVLAIGGNSTLMHTTELSVLVTLLRLTQRFTVPIQQLAMEIQGIQSSLASGERVAYFLQTPLEDSYFSTSSFGISQGHDLAAQTLSTQISPIKILRDFKGSVEFQNVSLSYNQDEVYALKNISFSVASGQKIALVGKTGSGKSSIVSLIARLYEFQEGDIKIDGISIRELNREWLRSQIGFITQDPIVFRGTVLDNIILDDATLTLNKIPSNTLNKRNYTTSKGIEDTDYQSLAYQSFSEGIVPTEELETNPFRGSYFNY